MDLTQQVLHMLQIIAPGFVLRGQEVFHDIAESLNSNAQGMKGHLRAIAQGPRVKFACRGPTLQREVLEYCASRTDPHGKYGQRFAPVPPLLAIKFLKGCTSLMFVSGLPGFEDLKERSARSGTHDAACGIGFAIVRALL